jgi:hypothetical protein
VDPLTAADRWDPKLRYKVEAALNSVTLAARDLLTRRTNDGIYVPPSEVSEGGDITGLIAVGRAQVLDPLAARVEAARKVLDAADRRLMTDWQRRQIEGG